MTAPAYGYTGGGGGYGGFGAAGGGTRAYGGMTVWLADRAHGPGQWRRLLSCLWLRAARAAGPFAST